MTGCCVKTQEKHQQNTSLSLPTVGRRMCGVGGKQPMFRLTGGVAGNFLLFELLILDIVGECHRRNVEAYFISLSVVLYTFILVWMCVSVLVTTLVCASLARRPTFVGTRGCKNHHSFSPTLEVYTTFLQTSFRPWTFK